MQAEVQDGVCGCMEFNTAAGREFCDRRFQWRFATGDADGGSIGRTLPACPEPELHIYPRQELTPKNTASVPCRQVPGPTWCNSPDKCEKRSMLCMLLF